MSNIAERIYKLVEEKGSTIYKLSKKIGVSNGYFSKQKKSEGAISSNIIEKIVIHYPDVNLRWLITGEGNMLNENIDVPEKNPVKKETDTNEPILQQMVILLSNTVKDLQHKLNRVDKKFDEIDEAINSISEIVSYQELNSITREIEEDEITENMQERIKKIEIKES